MGSLQPMIALMNKLAKVRSYLQTQLSEELCKLMTDHKSYIEVLDSIELLVSIVDMTFSLPYKHEDHLPAITFIDVQLEQINLNASFAREQDRLEMIRTLHAARVESGNGKTMDLRLLFNQVGGIFKPDEEVTKEDRSLQAALSAEVHRPNYENLGAAAQDRSAPKKNSESRSPRSGYQNIDELTQLI
jgi:hypothetical protein